MGEDKLKWTQPPFALESLTSPPYVLIVLIFNVKNNSTSHLNILIICLEIHLPPLNCWGGKESALRMYESLHQFQCPALGKAVVD